MTVDRPGTATVSPKGQILNKVDGTDDVRALVARGHFYGHLGIFVDDGDRVQCHICGKMYISLASHVVMAHGILADDYRELFGLNYGQGLVSSELRGRLRAKGKRLYREGRTGLPLKPIPFNENPTALAKVVGRPQRNQSYRHMRATHPPTYVTKACIVCGEEFTVSLTDDRLTCGDPCRHARRSQIIKERGPGMLDQARRAMANPAREAERRRKISLHRRGPRVQKVCPICGDAFELPTYRLRRRRGQAIDTCRKPECTREIMSRISRGRKHTPEALLFAKVGHGGNNDV